MRSLIIVALLLITADVATAQSCPPAGGSDSEAPVASSLHGTLAFHDDLRQWLGLKLDKPACGQEEIEVVFADTAAWRRAQSFRGCTVTINGKLYESPTGYYSTRMAISGESLKSESSCHTFPIEPDPSLVRIPPTVKTFYASINVNYRGHGHVDIGAWQGRNKNVPLKPWQAYVEYFMTSEVDVLWFGCPEGFDIKNVRQIPKSPSGFMPGTLPGDTLGTTTDLHANQTTITFDCQRTPQPKDLK